MPLKHIFLNNFRWKLAALVLAVFVWFAIKFAIWRGWRPGDEERLLTMPAHAVMVLSRPDDPGLFQIQPGQVDVLLRGPANIMGVLNTNQVQVFVNLTEMPEATPPAISQVLARAPDGVRVVRLAPPAVVVERLNQAPLPH